MVTKFVYMFNICVNVLCVEYNIVLGIVFHCIIEAVKVVGMYCQ